jgi:DNA polymerase-3 subunit epsilon
MDLDKLIVLYLDCQTTGSNPRKGRVIEIGWARSDFSRDCGFDEFSMHTHVLQQPPECEIPERIQAITGIGSDEIDNSHEPDEVWTQLLADADEIARLDSLDKCPVVIHYARFEAPFLFDLHNTYSAQRIFPFKVICTHAIAKRLFPELPRRSLRAMAGYFGYSLGPARRAREHVIATAFVWRALIGELQARFNITTLEKLQQWLDQPMVFIAPERTYPMAKEVRNDLPDKSGVYRMLRSNGDVLYVGKASSLKKRVASYFRKSSRHPEHILEMLSQAKNLDITTTGSVMEAAILESDEIKRLSPPYNVALRGGERDVWFCSSDLREFKLEANDKYRVGPLLFQDAAARLGAIRQLVITDDVPDADETGLMAAVGIPEGYAPEIECARAGFEAFLDRYQSRLARRNRRVEVTRIANELWLERLAERETENEESDELVLQSEKVPIWTPETVCHVLESNLVRGCYELRRARWLVLLSEAALAWEEMNDKQQCRYLIMFEKGQVLYHRLLEDDEIPVPPGHTRSYSDRQRSFDLMTADRLRVVTTEVRKTVAAGRWVKVCLRPNVILDSDKLTRMFRWI